MLFPRACVCKAGMPDVDDEELAAELDALGEEISADADTSYLDEALIPSTPDKEPQKPQPQKNKVPIRFQICCCFF